MTEYTSLSLFRWNHIRANGSESLEDWVYHTKKAQALFEELSPDGKDHAIRILRTLNE